MTVVKAALSVSHGQADVERGFSLNKHVVDETLVSLKEKTIVALDTVKDVINRYDGVENLHVSKPLLTQYRSAHASHLATLAAADQ